MNEVISDLTSKSFQVTVQIDDSLTAKERPAAEDPNNQEVDYGDLGDVIVAYDVDQAEQLLRSFTEQLVTLRPDAILN